MDPHPNRRHRLATQHSPRDRHPPRPRLHLPRTAQPPRPARTTTPPRRPLPTPRHARSPQATRHSHRPKSPPRPTQSNARRLLRRRDRLAPRLCHCPPLAPRKPTRARPPSPPRQKPIEGQPNGMNDPNTICHSERQMNPQGVATKAEPPPYPCAVECHSRSSLNPQHNRGNLMR